MKKLSNVNFGVNESIIGGDGFDCVPVAYACDDAHPTSHTGFVECMFYRGCL
jgi:hypothetical protein